MFCCAVFCPEILKIERGMEQAPDNSKESSHSAHANGMNE
jgi:hypothetical protein